MKQQRQREYLLYESVPEETTIYEITNMNPEFKRVIRASHGKYANSDEWPEMETFCELIELFEQLPVVLDTRKAGPPPILDGKLYCVGFMM